MQEGWGQVDLFLARVGMSSVSYLGLRHVSIHYVVVSD